MSLYISNNETLTAYIQNIVPEVFLSTTYTLTSNSDNPNPNPFFIEINSYFVPIGGLKLTYFNVDFGDGNIDPIEPNTKNYHNYQQAGTYYISYSAVYEDASRVETYVPYNLLITPITVKNKWDNFDEKNIRLNNEIELSLPYTLDQIKIQPNEWGVADIFNTAISRLSLNLEYLKSNVQTINIKTPSYYFGWMGNNSNANSSYIKWFTETYNYFYYKTPEIATSGGNSSFLKIKDSAQINDYFYVIDNKEFKIFNNSITPTEIVFKNKNEIKDAILLPNAFDVDETGQNVYICDAASNKIYNLYIDFENLVINLNFNFGGFGNFNDHNKFNSPTEIRFSNENIYVLDYNNFCIKQYNKNLNWLFTYASTILDTDNPVSFDVHPKLSLLYVLSKNNIIYIFDNESNVLYESFPVKEINDGFNSLKIIFDDFGEFIYILTEKNVYKYTVSGYFINSFNIPKGSELTYNNIKKGDQKTLIISTDHCILKCQDVLDIYKIGAGLAYNYWSDSQLLVLNNEFASDIIYNRSLLRIVQNIKTFRDTLNFKFNILTQETQNGPSSYFTISPVSKNELPIFETDIENETLGVGVNELHVPEVLNKELEKIYNSLISLSDFLAIKNINYKEINCENNFCWSWKATSCFNIPKPIVKVCGTNPISYAELESNWSYQYAPTTIWAQASSCCVE